MMAPDEFTPEERYALRELLVRSEGDGWLRPLRGGLPVTPSVDALPTAGVEWAYARVVLRGTPDKEYVCLRNASGAWGWREAATG